MIKRTLLVFIFSLVCGLSASWSADATLNGKWLLTFDPDGPVVEDWMIFYESGSVDMGGKTGIYLKGTYTVEGNSVTLVANVKGKTKKLLMSAQDGFLKLINHTGAVYEKQ
jgi:hypothetical protein